MALSPDNTLQQNLFETIKSNMENKDFTIDDKDSNKINALKKGKVPIRRTKS